MPFKKVTHVIFDMDGLLLETESIYDNVISEIARPFGKTYTTDIRLKIMGTPDRETARIAIEEMQLPYSIDQFLEIYKPKVIQQIQNPPFMPGARELVQHLHKHNIPIAVATSSPQHLMELKTRNHQAIFRLFNHIVCGTSDSEVKRGKPAPDIFLVCASRFPDQPNPNQCLVLEDSPNGAKGALDAGMQVVLIPAPDVPQEARKPATLVVNSLKELDTELFGLPKFVP